MSLQAEETPEMPMADPGEPVPLVWFFDLVSPFSYLALPAVEALAQRRGVAFRPVVLGAILAHWGSVGPAEIPPKRRHTYRLCRFMAERTGMELRFPPRHPFRSLDALRVVTALGADPVAVRTAFDFVWAEGRDPSDPVELRALAGRLGVDDHAALVERRGARAALREATEGAIAAGVFGVPTLMIGTELFWGVDAVPLAHAYLEDGSLFSRGEMARLEALPIGVERTR